MQVHLPDLDTQKNGQRLLRSTLESMAPVRDDDVLEAVEEAANAQPQVKELQDIASSMWEATLKARPNDDDLLLTVFQKKIAAYDWEAGRKVSALAVICIMMAADLL